MVRHSRLAASALLVAAAVVTACPQAVGQERVATCKGPKGYVAALEFSPDGKILACAGPKETITLWDVRTGNVIRTLDNGSWVCTLAFSPDGKGLAVASTVPDAPITRVLFPGASITTSTVNGALKIWDLTTYEATRAYGVGKQTPLALAYRDDLLVSAGEDAIIRTLVPASGRTVKVLDGLGGEEAVACISTKRTHVACGTPSGDIKVTALAGGRCWDAKLGERIRWSSPSTVSLALSDDGRVLAAAGRDIKVWEGMGRTPVTLQAGRPGVSSLMFSRDGKMLYAGTGSSKGWKTEHDAAKNSSNTWQIYTPEIQIWDVERQKLLRALQIEGDGVVRRLALSPDGATLASAVDDGTIVLWCVGDKKGR